MTDEKVQELAEKYFPDVMVELGRVATTVSKQTDRSKCAEAVREALYAARNEALEEAAHIADRHKATWLSAEANREFDNTALAIRRLITVPPAAISDCATSDLEAARNTSKQKEKA